MVRRATEATDEAGRVGRRALLAGAAAMATTAAVGCSRTDEPPTPRVSSVPLPASSSRPVRTPAYTISELGRFDNPWAAAFLPGTPWLAITQRGGTLVLRDMETGRILTVSGTPTVLAEGQGGLGDVVPAPDFTTTGMVYLTWAAAGSAGAAGAKLGRGRLEIAGATASLVGFEELWSQDPHVSGRGHYSHRVAFAADGKHLFLTSGDRQKGAPAQDLSNTLGCVLRLNPDGTAAAGNPFADRGGVSAQIWSYGHRNMLGIDLDASGRVWVSEMGPKGGDELNLVTAGGNYGWPNVSNGSEYSGADIPDHQPGDGYLAPKVWWNPSISPGSLLIYRGAAFPEWQGDALIGALSGEALIRCQLDGDQASKADQWNLGTRIRAIAEDADGLVYLFEDGDNGRLFQLSPA